jgi:hypothetical protein
MILTMGGVIKSARQNSAALSSGEAEYCAVVQACAEALGAQAVPRDFGWRVDVKLHSDRSAAKALASRVGRGKVRLLKVKHTRG